MRNMGKLTEAISAFQGRPWNLMADAHYALNGLARLYVLQKIAVIRMLSLMPKRRSIYHQLPQYLQTLALAHLQAGQREKALKAIRTAIEMEPENEAFQETLTEIQGSDEKTK